MRALVPLLLMLASGCVAQRLVALAGVDGVVTDEKQCFWALIDGPPPARPTNSLFLCCVDKGHVLETPLCTEAEWRLAEGGVEFVRAE